MQKYPCVAKYTARFWFYLLIGSAFVLLVVACGSSTTSTGSAAGGATATATTAQNTTPTSNGYDEGRYGSGGKYGNGGRKTTPTASSSHDLIHTVTATVNSTSETILTHAQGLTLYYRTSDIPPATVCSGGCAGAWPPLLVTGSNIPTSATSLPGKLSVQATANGNQVEYNGHPQYTYSGDTAPGQTNGEGIGGVWHVVTPNLS